MEKIIKLPYNFTSVIISIIALYQFYLEFQSGLLSKTLLSTDSIFKFYFYFRLILGLIQLPAHLFLNGIRYSSAIKDHVSTLKMSHALKSPQVSTRVKICVSRNNLIF